MGKFSICIFLPLCIVVLACGEAQQEVVEKVKTEMNTTLAAVGTNSGKIKIELPSMQCGSCAKKITALLSGLNGVNNVEVNLDEKIAFVDCNSEEVKTKDLELAVAAAGYDVNSIERDHKAYDKLPDCCKMPEASGNNQSY